MSLKFTLTTSFFRDAETIRAELSEHLEIEKPNFLFQASTDPPSVLELLGDALSWLPLKAAAAVYLATLAKRAGEATWDRLAAFFENDEVKPLANVVKTLQKAANGVNGEAIVTVGLNIPNNHFGTAVSIELDNPGETARVIASFVVHVEQLSKAMQVEVEEGRTPFGRAIIELQNDGSLLVKWLAQADDSYHELRIPAS